MSKTVAKNASPATNPPNTNRKPEFALEWRQSERRANYRPENERQRCEVWTRVMGYHRPVASFNRGKVGEFNERKFFDERSSRGASS